MLSPSDELRTKIFLPVIDQFVSSLQRRHEAYSLVDERFGFLNKLDTLENDEISTAAKNLVKTYAKDLDNQ